MLANDATSENWKNKSSLETPLGFTTIFDNKK